MMSRPLKIRLTLLMSTEIKGCESTVADSKLFGCCRTLGQPSQGDTTSVTANGRRREPYLDEVSVARWPRDRSVLQSSVSGLQQQPNFHGFSGLDCSQQRFPSQMIRWAFRGPLTCAGASFCRHCQGRERGVWRVCLTGPATPIRRRLFQTQSEPPMKLQAHTRG